jgi:hypothetical protein
VLAARARLGPPPRATIDLQLDLPGALECPEID